MMYLNSSPKGLNKTFFCFAVGITQHSLIKQEQHVVTAMVKSVWRSSVVSARESAKGVLWKAKSHNWQGKCGRYSSCTRLNELLTLFHQLEYFPRIFTSEFRIDMEQKTNNEEPL